MFGSLVGEIGEDLGGIGPTFLVGTIEQLGRHFILLLQQGVLAGELGFIAFPAFDLGFEGLPLLIESCVGDRVTQAEDTVNERRNDQQRPDDDPDFPTGRKRTEPFELRVSDHGK